MVHKATEKEEKKMKFFKGWAKEINMAQKFPYVVVNGKYLKRVKYGKHKLDYYGSKLPERCHDCGARVGMYHAIGCDWERIPDTSEQMLGHPKLKGFATKKGGKVYG